MGKLHTASTALIAAAGMMVWLGTNVRAQESQTGAQSKHETHESQSRTDSNDQKMGRSQSGSDQKFLEKAAEGGLLEVELGRLAEQKAGSADVKEFAKQMVDDHTKANDKLKSVASKLGVTVPAQPDKKGQKEIDRLSKLSGADFDREYMRWAVRDHRQDISEFRRAADRAQNSDVKDFASKMVPDLEHHLQMAQDTGTKVGALSGRSTSGNASQPRTEKDNDKDKDDQYQSRPNDRNKDKMNDPTQDRTNRPDHD